MHLGHSCYRQGGEYASFFLTCVMTFAWSLFSAGSHLGLDARLHWSNYASEWAEHGSPRVVETDLEATLAGPHCCFPSRCQHTGLAVLM